MMKCSWCREKKIDPKSLSWDRKNRLKKTGRAFCSKKCGRAYTGSISSQNEHLRSEAMRKASSNRMKRNNPMKDPRARAAMATTLRAMGHCPKTRGGNGSPPPLPVAALAAALGWPIEHPVPAGHGARKRGLATSYKLDIANPVLKIGIEVDGSSHASLERQRQDRKKQRFLEQLGWIVLRFSNEEVTADLAACVQMVLSTISKSKTRTPM